MLYCYPEEITDELIEVIKTEEKVCNYIDMPIQHSENRILQRMGRRTSREDLVAVIKKLRKEIPDITIRTTLITGFPGESQEDHEGLMNFVEECKFDRLGVFTYSPEEDTLAEEDRVEFNTLEKHHLAMYNACKEYYEQLLGVEVDGSGKDISRGFFTSFDEKAYLNEELMKEVDEILTTIVPPEKPQPGRKKAVSEKV